MAENKIILIGPINDYDMPTGPSNVIINLLKQDKKNFTFINSYYKSKLEKIKLYLKLISLIFVRNKIINVHSFGYRVPKMILNISKINKSNKYFLTLHGLMSLEAKFIKKYGFYNEYKRKSKYYDKLEKKLICEFPNVICMSNMQKEILTSKYGRYSNTFILYNGININKEVKINKFILDSIQIVMAGGIFELKGIFELIDFIDYYNKNYHMKLYLNIFGGIESEEILNKFKKIIIDKNLEKYVVFRGKIDNNALLDELEASHFCITFSKFDSFNLTILESMSRKTPAIISKQAGVSELINDYENGFVIDMNQNFIKQTAEIINNILENKYKYNYICNNAYETAQRNTWDIVYKRYKKILGKGI